MKKIETKIKKEEIEGLKQTFKNRAGKITSLVSVLRENDFWQTAGKVKRTILTHDAVKKLADLAGVNKLYKNTILTQPDAYNNYQYTWQVEIVNHKNEHAIGIGEANRNNLGTKGRSNPANMAEKRAYDRAVLRLLGITGLLSEEELSDEETENNKMEGLSHEDKKTIAPTVNQLLLAKTKDDFLKFNNWMKLKIKQFNPEQLDYLRKLYKKRLAEIQKTSF